MTTSTDEDKHRIARGWISDWRTGDQPHATCTCGWAQTGVTRDGLELYVRGHLRAYGLDPADAD